MPVGAAGLGGAFSAGMTGIQRGQQQLAQSAQQIASTSVAGASGDGARPVEANQESSAIRPTQAAGPQGSDVNDALVRQQEAELQVQASAKVVETADKTIGSLVDISV